MLLTYWGKSVFVNINPFYRFDQKKVFKQIQIFLRICPFQTWGKKNFLSISVLLYEIVTFLTKKRSSLWITRKTLQKNPERHSFEVCGSLCGEKQFLLIFICFYWFDQNFLQDLPLIKYGKKNNLSEYFSARFYNSHFYA